MLCFQNVSKTQLGLFGRRVHERRDRLEKGVPCRAASGGRITLKSSRDEKWLPGPKASERGWNDIDGVDLSGR